MSLDFGEMVRDIGDEVRSTLKPGYSNFVFEFEFAYMLRDRLFRLTPPDKIQEYLNTSNYDSTRMPKS